LGARLTTPPRKKNIVTKPQEEVKAHPGLMMMMMMMMMMKYILYAHFELYEELLNLFWQNEILYIYAGS
jgi:hypothetical protein